MATVIRNSSKFNSLKVVHLAAAQMTNGSYTNVFMDGQVKQVLRVTLFQTNTETNAKDFTVDAYTESGQNINTLLSISNNLSKILELDPENQYEFVVNNFDAYTSPPLLKLKNMRISQNTADGTAQTIKIQVVYLE